MSDRHTNPSSDQRAFELRRQQQQRLSRFFLVFAMVEGAAIAACVLAIFVLELIDPDLGIWVLLAVAALGATILSAYILTRTRRNQQELEELARHDLLAGGPEAR